MEYVDDLLGGAWLAADDVECMNCSVRSLDSFMFCEELSKKQTKYGLLAHLCPDLQHILECHASVRELALQQHDDVMVVLLQLLTLR